MPGFLSIDLPAGAGVESPLLDSPAFAEATARAEEVFAAIADLTARRTTDAYVASALDDADIAGLGGGLVTPEMILAIARRRIDDLDDQVVTIMDELNRRTAAASEISDHLGVLRNTSSDIEQYYDDRGDLDMDAPMNHLGQDPDGNGVYTMPTADGGWTAVPTVQEYLDALRDRGALTPSEHSAIIGGREGMQNLIDDANESLRDVNSGNEMLMIQLQSTMQSRTSIVQTATNLLKTLDDANDSIVGNLR